MAKTPRETIFDAVVSERVAMQLAGDIKAAVQHRLAAVGLEAVFEDATGVLVVPVVDARHVGTAYLEVRDGGGGLRVLLAGEQAATSVA